MRVCYCHGTPARPVSFRWYELPAALLLLRRGRCLDCHGRAWRFLWNCRRPAKWHGFPVVPAADPARPRTASPAGEPA